MKILVVLGGSISNYAALKQYINDFDYSICADGGARSVINLGIVPDVLIGDFDSILPSDKQMLMDQGVSILEYPKRKDFTDSELAINLALEKGADELTILGGIGSRMDHTLANILLLKQVAQKGVRVTLANENNILNIICGGESLEFSKIEGFKLSVLPISERVEGINTRGLSYPLVNAVIEMGQTVGISNEFSSDQAQISISTGCLLVIRACD